MNMKKFLKAALGTGLFILDQSELARKGVRERIGDHVDGLRDVAQDTFQAAAGHVTRTSEAFRTKEDYRAVWNVLRFAAGVGLGVGVGLLFAPATGEETRTKLAEKAQELGANARQHFASSDLRATRTGG
jgi:YtxH-like protein